MNTLTLSVPEISCDHCKDTIEGALDGLDGVEHAEVDVASKTVTVTVGDADVRTSIVGAIEGAGFDVAN